MPNTTTRSVTYEGQVITYTLTKKKIKNIYLRIDRDSNVSVSCPLRATLKLMDSFVLSHAENILSAIEKNKSRSNNSDVPENTDYLDKALCLEKFMPIAKRVHAMFCEYEIPMPQIKVRTMKSLWGSCNRRTCVVTLNSHLVSRDEALIEYVIIHEFCHFIHPNHSKDFYNLMATFIPDWKEKKLLLKNS